MAKIIMQDPGSTEVQSPLIAGLSEGLSKISSALNLKTGTFTDEPLSPVPVDSSSESKNKIFQIAFGKRLWLESPRPVVKRNGTVITQETVSFSYDYLGGSITFEQALADEDIVTVSATYITEDSTTLETISNLLSATQKQANKYKGYFKTEKDLTTQHKVGTEGDFAIVETPNFSVFGWDVTEKKWKITQSTYDFTKYYTKEEANNLFDTKEPVIAPKGDSAAADRQYWGGRKTWQSVDDAVRTVPLTGLQAQKGQVASTDTVLQAMGKLTNSANDADRKLYVEGTEAPTTATKGEAGQRYVNKSTGESYICGGKTVSGTYVWKQLQEAQEGMGLYPEGYPAYTYSEREKLSGLENFDPFPLESDISDTKLMVAGKANPAKEYSVKIPVGSWNPVPETTDYKADIAVPELEKDGMAVLDLLPEYSKNPVIAAEFAKIYAGTTQAGKASFTAKEKPAQDLTVRLTVSGSSEGEAKPLDVSDIVNAMAIRRSVQGKEIIVNDVAPITHTVKCKVSGVSDLTSVKITRQRPDGTDSQVYTPLADGTVEGMTSLSPSMKISSDNQEATISILYNEDTQQYIDKQDESVKQYVNSNFAPAFKKRASGEVIAVDDASPVEHEVRCKVQSANIWQTKKVEIANPTGIEEIHQVIPKGTYYVSAKVTPDAVSGKGYRVFFVLNNVNFTISGDGTPVKFVLPSDESYIRFYSQFGISDSKGHTAIWDDIIISKEPKTSYTPYVPDLSKAKVSRYGLNLCEQETDDFSESRSGRIDFSYFAHGKYTISADVRLFPDDAVGTPGLTGEIKYKDGTNSFASRVPEVKDGQYHTVITSITSNPEKAIEKVVFRLGDYVYAGTHHGDAKNIMLTFNSDNTNYEPYKKAVYTPASDGTVSGMTSLSPNMTILSDTPGVIINAEYNRDVEKYVGSLEDRIATLETALAKI